MSTAMTLNAAALLADTNQHRVILQATLVPLIGDRFQPAGFPEIGHVIYKAPRTDRTTADVCIVDSAASMAKACTRWTLEKSAPMRSVGKRRWTKKAPKNGLKAPVPKFHTIMAAKNRKSRGLGRRNTGASAGAASNCNRERGKRARSTNAQPSRREAR